MTPDLLPGRLRSKMAGGVVTAKPLGVIRLPADGRCGCSVCRADAQRDDAVKDQALAALVYEAGVDVLRQRALDRVPAFQEAFEAAG